MPELVGGTSSCGMCSHLRSPAASTLACGMSSGDVILIDVTQKLLSAPTGSSSSLEVVTVVRTEETATVDKRIITAMRWVSRRDGTVSGLGFPILIYHSCQVANPRLLQTGDSSLVRCAGSNHQVAGTGEYQVTKSKNLAELIGITPLLWHRV